MSRVVLFTGGSGSNLLARSLEAAGVETTHIVSVFDNGGSTGKLRRIADLPAMGDIRNRLCALASTATPQAAAMHDLFAMRLSKRKSEPQLRRELDALVAGSHRRVLALDPARRREVLGALADARGALPEDFELAGTSLGNLLILGRHRQARSFLPAVEWAAEALGVGPRVLPVTLRAVHLGSALDDGRWLVGQATLTRTGSRSQGRIATLAFLLDEDTASRPVRQVEASPHVLEAIATADAVVFGFGSFYSSVLPHLLVSGVADAIAGRDAPRVLLANPTADRETDFMTVADILRTVEAHAGRAGRGRSPLLSHVVHFTGEGDLAIPRGDTGFFLETGGEVLTESEPLSLAAVADRATARVRSLLPAAPGVASAAREAGRPIVLFDLDHTLYDYAALRRGAATAALSTFCATPEETCDLLLEHLAPPATHVLRELGYPDLRRQWNCPAFYAWARLLDGSRSREEGVRALVECGAAGSRVRGAGPFEIRDGFRAAAGEPGAHWRRAATTVLESARADCYAAQTTAFERHLATHAELVPGARALLDGLAAEGVQTVIVTEGDTPVQRTKIEYLGLADLVTGAVVADQTLGVATLVEEIFRGSRAGSSDAGGAYDELAAFLVKTPPFYGKLMHALVAAGAADLEEAIEDPTFLTEQEWERADRPRVATVGDRHHKDLEPLLVACPSGVTAFRVVQGKYAAEHPLHEVVARRTPTPVGHFAGLPAVGGPLLAWSAGTGPAVARPSRLPDRAVLERFADSADGLSAAAADTLAALIAELARHSS